MPDSRPATATGASDITEEAVKKALQKNHVLYDRNGEEHYNIIRLVALLGVLLALCLTAHVLQRIA